MRTARGVARIAFADLVETRWANGAGRKAGIAAGPGWALAFAWLDGPAPFSDYSGFDRTITLIEGDGFVLAGADTTTLAVTTIGEPAGFDGGWRASCRLRGGPCLVLNAFSRRSAWRHRVVVTAPGDAEALAPGDYVVVLRGRATVESVTAGPRDCLAVAAPARADGNPDVLIAVARFDPAG